MQSHSRATSTNPTLPGFVRVHARTQVEFEAMIENPFRMCWEARENQIRSIEIVCDRPLSTIPSVAFLNTYRVAEYGDRLGLKY